MPKWETTLTGNLDHFLMALELGVLNGSVSASLEGKSNYQMGEVFCAVRVFERYSWFGSNRVSLSVTMLCKEDQIRLCAIASGGSQAMFWKINTLGEDSFLDQLRAVVKNYVQSRQQTLNEGYGL